MSRSFESVRIEILHSECTSAYDAETQRKFAQRKEYLLSFIDKLAEIGLNFSPQDFVSCMTKAVRLDKENSAVRSVATKNTQGLVHFEPNDGIYLPYVTKCLQVGRLLRDPEFVSQVKAQIGYR